MADLVPVLLGVAGLVDGERYVLSAGCDVVIGRSRSCDISLRRTAGYLKSPPATRDSDHDFNTVSRRHIRLTLRDRTLLTVQDLSTNGTFCNDAQLREPQSIDLGMGRCSLRLGTRESFEVVLLPNDDPRIAGIQAITGTGGNANEDDAPRAAQPV